MFYLPNVSILWSTRLKWHWKLGNIILRSINFLCEDVKVRSSLIYMYKWKNNGLTQRGRKHRKFPHYLLQIYCIKHMHQRRRKTGKLIIFCSSANDYTKQGMIIPSSNNKKVLQGRNCDKHKQKIKYPVLYYIISGEIELVAFAHHQLCLKQQMMLNYRFYTWILCTTSRYCK